MVGDGLRDDLLIFPFCFGPGMGYMLSLVGADSVPRIFRVKVGGRLKGDAGVVGAILVFPIFAGLAFIGSRGLNRIIRCLLV